MEDKRMPVLQSTPKLQLASHVRACLVGDQMIFLDLQRSKYIGVGGSRLDALSAAVLGQASADPSPAAPSNPDLLDGWVRRLRSQQLLSDVGECLTEMRPTPIEAIASLDTDDIGSNGQDWRHLLRLWRSTWVVSAWLRRYSLADIADRIAHLRVHHSYRRAGHDAEDLRVAVGAYLRLRPFALTAHDRCLNDSLTLIHFLASQGMFPRWVIGVRAHPFYAHSWVQSDGVVLNDAPARVRRYQPILVV